MCQTSIKGDLIGKEKSYLTGDESRTKMGLKGNQRGTKRGKKGQKYLTKLGIKQGMHLVIFMYPKKATKV